MEIIKLTKDNFEQEVIKIRETGTGRFLCRLVRTMPDAFSDRGRSG